MTHALGDIKIGCLVEIDRENPLWPNLLKFFEDYQSCGLVIEVFPSKMESGSDHITVMFPDKTLTIPDYLLRILGTPNENL